MRVSFTLGVRFCKACFEREYVTLPSFFPHYITNSCETQDDSRKRCEMQERILQVAPLIFRFGFNIFFLCVIFLFTSI